MDEIAVNGQPRAGEIRILDDDREVLAFLLRAAGGLGRAVRGFDDPDQFLQVDGPPPACLLVDWQLRGRDGLEVIAQCQRQWPDAPVILITGHATIPVAVTAMRQGVVGVLEKPVLPAHLVREIQFALHQSQCRSAAEVERCRARRLIESLNEQELTVLKLVVGGTPNKNIAGQLRVAMRTAEKYRRSVFDKLGVDSAPEATRIWVLANQEP
ncbi:MAG TPA: response regulator [Pirellulaceae bacterium]|nr:response regulator [Pirellulaceae bacterium]